MLVSGGRLYTCVVTCMCGYMHVLLGSVCSRCVCVCIYACMKASNHATRTACVGFRWEIIYMCGNMHVWLYFGVRWEIICMCGGMHVLLGSVCSGCVCMHICMYAWTDICTRMIA